MKIWNNKEIKVIDKMAEEAVPFSLSEATEIEEPNIVLHEQILGDIYLYVDWRSITKHLTTEQKEAWADVVEREFAKDEIEHKVDRWWR